MKSKAIRQSAEGEDCTLNIVGVCNYNPKTTVLAHLPDESKGMGRKSDDISACYACSDCHDVIDGRDMKKLTALVESGDLEWYMRRAMVRTWRRLVDKGFIIIKGSK